MDFLFEGWAEIYFPLAAVLVISLALWWRDRKRRWLVGAAVVASLMGLYFALDRAVETDSEQIRRKLGEMGAAIGKKDTKAAFVHFSDQFTWDEMGGMKKAQVEQLADGLVKAGRLTDVTITDVRPPDKSGKVVFIAKPRGPNIPHELHYRIKAQFVREPDGQWRLKSFTTHNPVNDDPIEVGRLREQARGLR